MGRAGVGFRELCCFIPGKKEIMFLPWFPEPAVAMCIFLELYGRVLDGTWCHPSHTAQSCQWWKKASGDTLLNPEAVAEWSDDGV